MLELMMVVSVMTLVISIPIWTCGTKTLFKLSFRHNQMSNLNKNHIYVNLDVKTINLVYSE